MKRLLIIASGMFVNSIVPILTWFLISLILKDGDLTNVFALTYPFQFVVAIIVYLFGSGANIRKEKENNQNAVWSSIIVGTISLVIFLVIPMILCDQFLSFMSLSDPKYKTIAIYSLILYILSGMLNLIAEKLYFENREKFASKLIIIFSCSNLALISIFTLIFKNLLISSIITLIILAIYITVIYIKEFKKFKFDLKIFTNFKYVSSSICTYIIMFLIYFFGNKIVFSMGIEYVTAVNLVTLCTDAQWDSTGAVSKIAQIDISRKQFNFKQHYLRGLILTLILMASSCIMFFSLFRAYNVVLKIGIIYLMVQMIDLILYALTNVMETYCQLEVAPTLTTVGMLLAYIVRVIITVSIMNPFCEDIGQLANSVVCYSWFIPLILANKKKKKKKIEKKL